MMIVPGAGSDTLLMSAVMPVFRPVQVAPASVVEMIVPKLPTAYPTPPLKPMSLIELPCGVGVPHPQPDCPLTTWACAVAANAISATRPPTTATDALFRTLSPLTRCWSLHPERVRCDPNGNGSGEVAFYRQTS